MEPVSGIGAARAAAQTTTINTDEPDREVRELKQLWDTLEQRLGRAGDPSVRENLQKRLAQVERQLQTKDNDGYRRQHSKVTNG